MITVYADENYYKDSYLCGRAAVITSAFEYYVRSASQLIRQHTYSNINENSVPDSVKLCCCELAELLYKSEDFEKKHGETSSESVQGWSKSFESKQERQKALNVAARNCIYKWLGGTGLLFAGVK